MNRLTSAIARLCHRHLLEEKWLLAPSLRAGHQWLDAVTRTGQPAANVRIKTLRSIALELAAPEMAAKNLGLLPGHAGPMLVEKVFRRLRTDGLAYLGALRATAGRPMKTPNRGRSRRTLPCYGGCRARPTLRSPLGTARWSSSVGLRNAGGPGKR